MTYWLIEPPSPAADLDTWERHLASLAALPQDDEGVIFSTEHAKRHIDWIKGGRVSEFDDDEEYLAEIDAILGEMSDAISR